MKHTYGIAILLTMLMGLSACEDSEVLVDPGYSYFPIDQGRYWVYEVDSIVHDIPVGIQDTFRYAIREVIDTTFFDAEQRATARIERSYASTIDGPWQLRDIWVANRTNSTAERVEENIRYIKLAFPINEEQLNWDGNAQNNLDEWEYSYTALEASYSLGVSTYDKTCTVEQRNRVNAIERELAYEVYADEVGMIFKQYDILDLEPIIIDGVATSQIVRGLELEMRLVESGQE